MGEKQTRTLIAAFEQYSTACQAARDLNENGIPQDAIYIDSNQKTAGAGSAGYSGNAAGTGSNLAEWWDNFIGSDREQQARRDYETALAGGRTILRAVVSEELTDLSTDILNQHGAAEIETRSQPSTGASQSASPRSGVHIYSHDRLYPAEPRKASTMHSTSFKRGSDSVLSGFGTTPGAGTLAGEATAGSAIQDFSFQDLTDQEEISDYKRHFEQNYPAGRGDFESIRGAYEFGGYTAADERFRKMTWDDAEAEIRSGYEHRRAALPWEEARPAVRYAWERGKNR